MRFFLFLLLFTHQAIAQSISGIATYRLETLFDSESNQYSVTTYELRFNQDQSEYVYVNSPSENPTKPARYGIFKDFTRRRMIAPESTLEKYYFVEDSLSDLAWKVSTQERMIGKWKCQAASAQVRGRDYEVWFTPEIPVEDGPWKFYGLPGLILEVRSSDDKVRILLDKLELKDTSVAVRPIYHLGNPQHINSKKFEQLLEKSLVNRTKSMNTQGTSEGSTTVTYKMGFEGIEIYPFQRKENNE